MRLICPTCHAVLDLAAGATVPAACPSCGSGIHHDSGPTAPAPCAPRRLGRFELLEELGKGGFGTVWRARDPELGREVAVKVPRDALDGDADRERFGREARAAAALRHPGIVPVFEVSEHDGQPFLVSELVKGVTLADLLTARRPSAHESARIIAAVADALHHAHQQGVVHRDVKPSNVMLDDRGEPRLMDFGLARRDKLDATLTQEGQLLGTPAYMSPEQARGEGRAVDRRSDVYGLGAVLYQLLTGETPFRGNVRMQLEQVLCDEPRPPHSLNDAVPRDLETVCLKCLEKDPRRRYQTAAELAADLRRFLAGEPVLARPVGRLGRAWRWARRRPAAAALVAVSAAALLLIVAGLSVASLLFAAKQRETQGALDREREAGEKLREALEREKAARSREQQAAYYHRITQADRALAAGDVARALVVLAACPEELRGWEWRYLMRQTDAGLFYLARGLGLWSAPDQPPEVFPTLIHVADLGDEARLNPYLGWEAPDGRTALVLRRGGAAVLDLGDGHALHRPAFRPPGAKALLDEPGPLLVALAPGGGRVALLRCGEQGGKPQPPARLAVWDAAADRLLWQHADPDRAAGEVAFSPDGTLLVEALAPARREAPLLQPPDAAAADLPGLVRVCDAATGAEVFALPLGADFRGESLAALFSPDGRRLAVFSVVSFRPGGSGTAEVWDVPGRRRLCHIRGAFTQAAFSPDGALFAAADNFNDASSVLVWDAATGKEVHVLQHAGTGLAFSPDGRRLATVSPDPKRGLQVWQMRAPAGQDRLLSAPSPDGRGRHRSVAFSPDGLWLALGGSAGGLVTVVSSLDGRPAARLPGAAAHFTPDGAALVCWVEFGVAVCDLTTRLPPAAPPPHEPGAHLALGPGGRRAAAAGRDVVLTAGGRVDVLKGHTRPVRALAFSADGARLVSAAADPTALGGDGELIVWDVATAREAARWRAPARYGVERLAFGGDGATVLALAGPRGRTLADLFDVAEDEAGAPQLVGRGSLLLAWEAGTGRELWRRRLGGVAHPDRAVLVPDRLVVLDEGGALEAWSTADGRRLWSLPRGPARVVAVGPDGATAALAETKAGPGGRPPESVVRLLDLADGAERGRLTLAGRVWAMAFRPDGRLVAVGAGTTVHLIDSSGRGQRVMSVDSGRDALAWHADGRRLAVPGHDGEVVIWDADAGAELLTLPAPAGAAPPEAGRPASLAFVPGGGLLLGPPEDARLWDAVTATPEAALLAERAARLPLWHLRQAEAAATAAGKAADEAEEAARRYAARFHLGRLRGHEPVQVGAHLRRADVAVRLGRDAEARAELLRAVERHSDDQAAYHGLAVLAVKAGDAALYRRACAAALERAGALERPLPGRAAARRRAAPPVLAGVRGRAERAGRLRAAAEGDGRGLPRRGAGGPEGPQRPAAAVPRRPHRPGGRGRRRGREGREGRAVLPVLRGADA
jgi:WD40 repeat protein